MIRVLVADADGRPKTVLLGLHEENMSRLREGQPVRVNLRHLAGNNGPVVPSLPDLDVVVFIVDTASTAMIMAAAERSRHEHKEGGP